MRLRPEDLQASGLGVTDVVQALAQQNLAAPVGQPQRRRAGARHPAQGPAGRRRRTSSGWWWPSGAGRLMRLGQVANVLDGTEEQRTAAAFNGKEAVGIDILKAKGYSTTQVSDEIHERVAALQQRLPPGAKLEIVQDAGQRVSRAVRQRAGGADRGRPAHGAGGVPLPQLLALDRDHRPGAPGERAGVVRRGVGLRLHPQHDVAAGPVARDRHPDRRRHRRAREHRPPHRDGEGPRASRPARAPTRSGSRWRRRRSRSWPCSSRSRSCTGSRGSGSSRLRSRSPARCWCRSSCRFSLDPMLSAYWPDPQTEAHERRNPIARTLDRFNRWFDRQADQYKRVIAWALDHRLVMVVLAVGSFVGAIAMISDRRRRRRLHPGERPERDQHDRRGDRRDRTSTTPGARPRRPRRSRGSTPRCAYTYTTVGTSLPAALPGRGPGARVRAAHAQGRRGRSARTRWAGCCAREVAALGGAKVSVFTSGFGGAFKQIQIQLQGPDARGADPAGRAGAAGGGEGAGRGGRGALHPRAEAGARGASSSAGWPARSASRWDRWRRRCGRPSPASTSGDWVDPSGETRDVNVRLAPEARERTGDLAQLPLVVGSAAAGASPTTMPLGQIATIRQGVGPAQIDHLDREKVVIVQANVAGRSLNEVTTRDQRAARPAPPAAGLRASPRAARRATRRRSSPASSPRWAWRCCSCT